MVLVTVLQLLHLTLKSHRRLVLDLQLVGRVVSYDQVTGVLKYWQDRTNSGFSSDGSLDDSPIFGFRSNQFTQIPVVVVTSQSMVDLSL